MKKLLALLSSPLVCAALLLSSPVRASGDVPPDPITCAPLYNALCVTPGVCAAVCVDLCDGIDATDAGYACKVCAVTLAIDEWNACYNPPYVDPGPMSCAAIYGLPTCPVGYSDPSPCDATITSGCVSDGDLECDTANTSTIWTDCCLADDSRTGRFCGPCDFIDSTASNYCGE